MAKAQKKSRNSQNHKTNRESSRIDTERIVNKAQDLVSSAVNVLEEEIAAGILAAKKIEKKIISEDSIDKDPDALINRLRKDSHDVLDLMIDLVATFTGQLNKVLESVGENGESNTQNKAGTTQSPTNGVIILEPDYPLKPGEKTKISANLYEDEAEGPVTILLRKSDLIGTGDLKINSRALRVEPKRLVLSKNEEKSIDLYLSIPKNASPGRYNAFLSDANNPLIRILLTVEVVPVENTSSIK